MMLSTCTRCGRESPFIVEMLFGPGNPVGYVCEPCEEEVMTEISKKVPRAEGRRGLKAWRKVRDQRRVDRKAAAN